MNYDVIIIGGGAAGMAAALWCDELGLNVLIIESESEFGGQLLRVYNPIKNHLGTEAENGRELRDRFAEQTESRKFDIRLNAKIGAVDFENKIVSLRTGEKFSAEFLIIATGVSRRRLNVAGEDDFKGAGIIESGKRDADLARGKDALIVGGGDAAFENALILADAARSVTLVHRGANFRARREFVEQAENNPKIKILTETAVRKIVGGARAEAVELENTRTRENFTLSAETILIRIGVEPNTKFLRGAIETDANGYIKINERCETNAKGIFAIGDVANPIAPTVSSAIGMGATAVKVITNYKLRITNY